MAIIIINVDNIDNAADACREVADKIEEGYHGGIIGCTCDTWEISE